MHQGLTCSVCDNEFVHVCAKECVYVCVCVCVLYLCVHDHVYLRC